MPKISRFTTIAIALLSATALSTSLYWWQLLSSKTELHDKTLAQAMQTATRLAVAGAGQTEALIRNMDATLEDLRHDYITHRSEYNEAVQRAMRYQPDGLILQVGIIDEKGLLAYSSLGNPVMYTSVTATTSRFIRNRVSVTSSTSAPRSSDGVRIAGRFN